MTAILFLKKKLLKNFFSNFKGTTIRLGRIISENGVTIIWSVKSVGLQNLPFLKFQKKISQLWCPGKQCGQLIRSLKIWVGIVPYDGYHW